MRFSLGHHAQRRRIQQALGSVGSPARPRGTAAGQSRLRQRSRGAAGDGGRRGQRRRLQLGDVGDGRCEQEIPAAAQVRAMQEPRLRVAAQGPQALLHVAGLPVQEVQPDRRETARDGRAGECRSPGTRVRPRPFWIKALGPGRRHAGPEFENEAAVLADGPARSARGSRPRAHATLGGTRLRPRPRSSDVRGLLGSAGRGIPDPVLQQRVTGFTLSWVPKVPRISDPAFVAEWPGKDLQNFRPRPQQSCWVRPFGGSPGSLTSLSEQRVGGSHPSGIPDSAPPQQRAALTFGRVLRGAGAGDSFGRNRPGCLSA